MLNTYLPLGAGVLVVVVRLHSTLRALPSGGPKALAWLLAAGLLAAAVSLSLRTAARLRTSPAGDDAAVHRLTFFGLLLVTVALSLPDLLAMAPAAR